MDDLHAYTGRISEISNAFRQSQILFTAHEHGVFALLDEARTAADVAARIGCSVRGTAMLLDGLVALELLEKHGNSYKNAPVASACLVPGKTAYQGPILNHTRRSWDTWSQLSEAVRTGTGVKQGSHRPDSDELRDFILGMGNIAFLSAPDLLEHIDTAPYRHLLDIGGGPGTYTITFLRANPHLRATLMDLPPVIEIARSQVAQAGLANRVGYIAGDCTKEPLGHGYDLILISNLVHILSAEQNAALVKKCHAALDPGGTLIIKDFLADTDRSGPAFSLIFALHMLLHTEAGGTYAIDEARAWTDAAGFQPGELKSLTPKTRLWIARKIEYSEGPIDKIRVIEDFLPPPDQLVFRESGVGSDSCPGQEERRFLQGGRAQARRSVSADDTQPAGRLCPAVERETGAYFFPMTWPACCTTDRGSLRLLHQFVRASPPPQHVSISPVE